MRFFKSLLSAPTRTNRRSRLNLEALGDRVLPAVDVLTPPQFEFAASLVTAVDPAPTDPAPIGSDPPPATPTPPKTPSFASPKELEDALAADPTTAALLKSFKDAGGTVTGGPSPTGGHITLPVGGKPQMIVIDPDKTKDKNDAVSVLVFELTRFKNQAQQDALIADLKAGKITPDEYAEKLERLTYDYVKQANDMASKARHQGQSLQRHPEDLPHV